MMLRCVGRIAQDLEVSAHAAQVSREILFIDGVVYSCWVDAAPVMKDALVEMVNLPRGTDTAVLN